MQPAALRTLCLAHLYNNPKYSDLHIELRDGTALYAHRVVLCSQIPSLDVMLANKPLATVNYSNWTSRVVRVAIAFYYGAPSPSDEHAMPYAEWEELAMFAEHLDSKDLLTYIAQCLETIQPPDPAPDVLIRLGYRIRTIDVVWGGEAASHKMARGILMLERALIDSGYDHATIARTLLASLRWDPYHFIHMVWARKYQISHRDIRADLVNLLMLDCYYCVYRYGYDDVKFRRKLDLLMDSAKTTSDTDTLRDILDEIHIRTKRLKERTDLKSYRVVYGVAVMRGCI